MCSLSKQSFRKMKIQVHIENKRTTCAHHIGKNPGTVAQQNPSGIEHHSILHVNMSFQASIMDL